MREFGTMRWKGLILFTLFFLSFFLLSTLAAAVTRTVTNCADSGAGSLRQALTDALASDTVVFNITTAEAGYSTGEAYSGLVTSEAAGKSWFRIMLNSYLPAISKNNVWVQGSTQPVVESNNPAGPEIEVRMNGTNDNFTIGDGGPVVTGVTIEGLVLNRRGGINGGNGIALNKAQSCQILGCYIGISATGEGLSPNKNALGICPYNLSANNKIGNGTAGGRNVISGNAQSGIYIADAGTTNNQVLGNYIGLNSTGTAAIANVYGVNIQPGAGSNYIGDGTAGGRNIISGNASGIIISGASADNNQVLGNYIGTTPSGEAALPNSSAGVYIQSSAKNNKIGDGTAGGRNIISGNTEYGIYITGSGTNSNEVLGNYIGTTASGEGVFNYSSLIKGIYINQGSYNKIGNGTTGGRNLISGNHCSGNPGNSAGLWIDEGTGNEVKGNYIGTNTTGTSALQNSNGIVIWNGQSDLIGGPNAGDLNLISGNAGGIGIQIYGPASNNYIKGNYIGLKANGTQSLPNNAGITLYHGAFSNYIGGTGAGEGNVISGNSTRGITIGGGDETYSNYVLGNLIGTDKNGLSAVANAGECGIKLQSSYSTCHNNHIGDGTAAGRNIISGNGNSGSEMGIYIYNTGTNSNEVIGNYIGLGSDGSTIVANKGTGIYIWPGPKYNTIGNGTAGGVNVVSGNEWFGVIIAGSGSERNTLNKNYIGTDAAGTANKGNAGLGVSFNTGAAYNTVGPNNIIAYNGASVLLPGIRVQGSTTSHETITQNSIFDNYGFGISLEGGANQGIPDPTIASAGYSQPVSTLTVTGNSQANALVEVFKSQGNQGKTYLGNTTANGAGNWTASISGSFTTADAVTVTQTDTSNNTSSFAATREVTISTTYAYQPDNMIGSLDTGADYVGEGIFNADGTSQTKTKSFTCGDSATFYIKVKNAGNMTDYAIITGTGSLGSWAITYYDAKTGGSDITSQITGSGWATNSLASAETKEIRVVANYSGTISATKEILVTSTSSVDGVTKDAVKATVQAQAVVALDHFNVTAPASALAGCAFSITVTGKDSSNNTVSSISGTTSLSVETGTIAPASIDPSAFSAGAWTGNITLGSLGNRTVTVTNGSATGSAIILVSNATREYTSAELGIAGMSITVPAGAVTVEVTITASEVNSPADPPSGYKIGGKVFNIGCTPSTTFLLPVTVTIPIEGPLKAPRVYYWTGTEWSSSGITVISNTSTSLTFTTTHFTTFASFGALPANLVRFGPNPYNPNNGSGRFWYWLDADAETSIYLIDLGGTIVWKQSYASGQNGGRSGENNIEFKGQTAWGDMLGNGVYLYKIVQSGKSIGGGKIAVIK